VLRFVAEGATPLGRRAALYARTSTQAQAKRGTSRSQLDLMRHLAAAEGLLVVAEYVDDAVPGTIELGARAAGSRMLGDASRGSFDVVLVQNIDRLGRSIDVVVGAAKSLEGAGVKLRSACEPDGDLATLAAFADYERSRVGTRVTAGRDRASRDGQWTNSPVPFGYDVDALRRLIPSTRIVPGTGLTESQIARSVFENIAGGSSTVSEARRLNRLGVPNGRRYTNGAHYAARTKWLPNRINKMVMSSVYSGTRTLVSRHGPIAMTTPTFIELATFRKAQEQVHRGMTPRSREVDRSYPLRGLIRCVGCGNRFGRTTLFSSSGGYFRYYACSGRAAAIEPEPDLRCRAKLVPAAWLESAVLYAMQTTLPNDVRLAPPEIQIRTTGTRMRKVAHVVIRLTDGRIAEAVYGRS
jgi:site-specific DNA recombinase